MIELRPCPFCGSFNLEEDYTIVLGCKDESQSGYIECKDCGANGPWIEAKDIQIYDGTFSQRVKDAWNGSLKENNMNE